ncbi:MAG: AAA family ATPase, partial [bacterium]
MDDKFYRSPFNKRIQEVIREVIPPDPDELGTPPDDKSGKPQWEDIQFDLTPRELIDYLKSFIVGQDRAVEIVATKICTHFHRMKLEAQHPELPRIVGYVKPNILLIGPTGVGKTYLIKLIAHKLRVPFVKGDATKFSETGYVGGDVEDLVRELVYQAGGNIKLAEYGIIYIDEIDKIASSGSWWGPDVSRSGVQRNLLKLMEETEVDMKVPHDLASQMEAVFEAQRAGRVVRKKVNTRNILFVVSGAFNGLPEIIARRLKKGGMGFSSEDLLTRKEIRDYLEFLHAQDLVEYGFESEFVGRLPVITYFNELDEEALYGILKNPNSDLILSKKRDFASYNVELNFADDALRLIAREAHQKGIGARGLVGVVEKILLPFERS